MIRNKKGMRRSQRIPFKAANPWQQHALIRQGNIQLQHRAVVRVVEVDGNLIGFDINIFANHRDYFLLHLRQKIRLAQVAFGALMRNDNLQTLLGNRCRRGRALLAQVVKNTHGLYPQQTLQKTFLFRFQEAVRNIFAEQTIYRVVIGLTGLGSIIKNYRGSLVRGF